MLANAIGEGNASAAEPRCHPQIVRTTVRHPNPNSNPSAASTVKT